MTNFEGRKILVIGGSSGIGEATAKAFVAAGAAVTIASRSMEKLAAAAKAIGGDLRVVALDTTDAIAVESFFAAQDSFDHVVVSAAQTPSGPLRGLPLDAARSALESKFWGAYHVARFAKIAPEGSLTFISGFLGTRPSANAVLQGAINAALESLGRGLALELAPVRVNTVSPGVIATPLWSKLTDDARRSLFDATAEHLPAGRIGQPEDVARAIVYLAATPFATGSMVLVDGGGAIA